MVPNVVGTIQCRCVELLPIGSRTVVRQMDIGLNGLSAAMYDPRFGDLIYVDDVINQPNAESYSMAESSNSSLNQPDDTRMGR